MRKEVGWMRKPRRKVGSSVMMEVDKRSDGFRLYLGLIGLS